ncbi:MAG: ABC transporter permease [Butyrivibrio sp.]|nr:ABC transporter permease [Acetatifactor muris]MCM1558420.1 ABC transporter permease [Butyrivibrio sp.]
MYLTILKKDLRRKKTMNLILFIFVILAATFIAGSANNLITVSGALDDFLDRADVPDHWFVTANAGDVERFEEFAAENGYDYDISRLIQIDSSNVLVEGEQLAYSKTLSLATLGGMKIFDGSDREITCVNDGEIYITGYLFQAGENDFHEGGKVYISQGGVEKEFTVKGSTKDALLGSEMAGMVRFLISENDAELFGKPGAAVWQGVEVRTEDAGYRDKFNALGINTVTQIDRSAAKMIYIMDMLTAAILLVVSICLILISMVILRFIIHFTITEEFREIGVMKAIGIKNSAIRGLYIAKYFVIAVLGAFVGLLLSFPFSRLLLSGISRRIIISEKDNFRINVAAAVLTGAVVVLFTYLCTRRIGKLSPIDAIRSGETGERFRRKGLLHPGSLPVPTVLFMAANDILNGFKSYVSMILVFILGTLLVIIPVNTINTLRSDDLITVFNAAKCDHIISREIIFNPNEDNEAKIRRQFLELREMLAESGIEAEIFQEILFISNIRKGTKVTNALSFQGRGDVSADRYTYIDGTPPANVREVALSFVTAGQIGAGIGDDVEIRVGEDTRTYTVTALMQGMNNMGEGVRFHQDARLDYNYAAGCFGIQVSYLDAPGPKELAERKALLEKFYPESQVYSPGEYIGSMIGDVAGRLEGMKVLILSIILGINALVAVLMVKSFISREKREIGLLKAMGFRDKALMLWQTMRIGMVLILSVLVGTLLSTPLSTLLVTPVFRMMGAYSITFEIRPVEVYLAFPAVVLAVTGLAAFISARGVRNISPADISNNE